MKTYQPIGVPAIADAQDVAGSLVFDPRPDGSTLELAVIAGGVDTGICISVHRDDNAQGTVISRGTRIASFVGNIYSCKRHIIAAAAQGFRIPAVPMTEDEKNDTAITR